MIDNVTDKALTQLLLLADAYHIPQDQVVFVIEAKMRMPSIMIWYITPATSYDKRFIPVTVRDIRFAVEVNSTIFLVDATLDYDAELLKVGDLYSPTYTPEGKPVWPRGFLFENQKFTNSLT